MCELYSEKDQCLTSSAKRRVRLRRVAALKSHFRTKALLQTLPDSFFCRREKICLDDLVLLGSPNTHDLRDCGNEKENLDDTRSIDSDSSHEDLDSDVDPDGSHDDDDNDNDVSQGDSFRTAMAEVQEKLEVRLQLNKDEMKEDMRTHLKTVENVNEQRFLAMRKELKDYVDSVEHHNVDDKVLEIILEELAVRDQRQNVEDDLDLFRQCDSYLAATCMIDDDPIEQFSDDIACPDSFRPQPPAQFQLQQPQSQHQAQRHLDDARRLRAIQRIGVLIPIQYDYKLNQSLAEHWTSDDFMDWWGEKLFHGTSDWELAREFMHKLWFSNSDEFLTTWPFWSWPVCAKILLFLGPLGEIG